MASLTNTRPPYSEATIRNWWKKYLNNPESHVPVKILGRSVPVPDVAYQAFRLFSKMLDSYVYPGNSTSAWTYTSRKIAGTSTWSLHAFGIACDVDPNDNPYMVGATWADTLFLEFLVRALLAVRTNNNKRVFAWGGEWKSKQDLMHWYICCKPSDLETGIDYDTVSMAFTERELRELKRLLPVLQEIDRAVADQGSTPYGAVFYGIDLIRRHRPGGDLAPRDPEPFNPDDYEIKFVPRSN